MRGQGGTERLCLKARELISGVGQAMTVGTFGPMEWGAVVGLIDYSRFQGFIELLAPGG